MDKDDRYSIDHALIQASVFVHGEDPINTGGGFGTIDIAVPNLVRR